jgi:phospholipid/cholesterol/gamma-HCH transport system substrate-binding protein
MSRMSVVVGAFMVGGILLFAGGLFLIGDRRLLFARQFELNATFGKVTGLQVGGKVRLAGFDAGEVLEIGIPSRPSDPFRVRMRVREDLHQLVRTDSTCGLQTDGIVGSTFVQITKGTDQAPVVPAGALINGVDPIDFADVIREGRETFRTVSREIIDLKGDVSLAIGAVAQTAQSANGLIASVGEEIRGVSKSGTAALEEVQQVLANAGDVVEGVKSGRGTVGQLMTDDALYKRLTGLGSESEQTMRNIREATDRGRAILADFTAQNGQGQQMMQTMRDILGQTGEIVSDLADSTEALKRNFLFRGFFRQRGFYDIDAISRDAYAAGALERNNRTALKIWVAANVLFARDVNGTERLTDAGKRRLDSVMGDFTRYPRDSPLVVEGYSQTAQGESAYLTSVEQATLVRDYLRDRFRRKSNLLDFIAMGDEAVGSPSGDRRWAGVALALYVRNDALAASSR